MAGKRATNWLAVRTAYVVKGYTAQQCAEEFILDVTTVKKRASKEGWTKERHRNNTDATQVVLGEMRATVEAIAANHVAAADQQVKLTQAVSNRLATLVEQVELADIRVLRSIIEAGARLGEWTDKAISASRLSRGLKVGDSSDPADIEDSSIEAVRTTYREHKLAEQA